MYSCYYMEMSVIRMGEEQAMSVRDMNGFVGTMIKGYLHKNIILAYWEGIC